MNDLLTDPVFTTSTGPCSLPGLLERLSRGEDLTYPHMQAHHAHLFHMFLVQLAVAALHKAGLDEVEQDEATWRKLLLALATSPSSFLLEEPDLNKPAFLQPPAPDGAKAFKAEVTVPDELDVLVTSKNHDVKLARSQSPRAEHWVYVLIALQTSAGFGGAGNYGIASMNGGYASRPLVGFVESLGWGSRFVEDATRLVDALADGKLTAEFPFSDNASPLLWELPWDGKSSLPLEGLHPLFIEVTRRVRRIEGAWRRTTSKKPRIDAKANKGHVGNPWIPIKPKDPPEALNISLGGFHRQILLDIVVNTLRLPDFMRQPLNQGNSSQFIVCEVLAGKQGGTEGYHRRVLEVPNRVRRSLRDPEGHAALALLGEQMSGMAGEVRSKVLMPAVLRLYDEDPKHDTGFRVHLDRFQDAVDDVFFPALWQAQEREHTAAMWNWFQQLESLARQTLASASEATPVSSSRVYQRRAEAHNFLGAALYKRGAPYRPQQEAQP